MGCGGRGRGPAGSWTQTYHTAHGILRDVPAREEARLSVRKDGRAWTEDLPHEGRQQQPRRPLLRLPVERTPPGWVFC